MDKILLRPAEVATLLSVSRTRIYQLVQENEIPSVRIGGSVRVPVAALREWVTERTTREKPQ